MKRCAKHKRANMPMKERPLALLLCNCGMAIYGRQKCAIIIKTSAKVEIMLKILLVVPEV